MLFDWLNRGCYVEKDPGDGDQQDNPETDDKPQNSNVRVFC